MTDRLPDRAWVPAVGALVLAMVFVAALLVRAGGDVSLLVHAGPPWTDPAGARDSLTVQDADQAFDGQFFYRLGVAPWSTDETVDGVTFDLPSLRNARWGYGALAFVASGGNPDLVPWALVALNLVAATALGAIGGGLARAAGRHAAWGLLLVLWPGFAYSLSLDTSELVASTFAVGGLLALRHHRHVMAGLVLTAALITRDTAAVIPFGVFVAGLLSWRWARSEPAKGARAGANTTGEAVDVGDARFDPLTAPQRRRRSDGLRLAATGLVPLLVFGAWQLLQRARFGALPLTSSGDNNLSAPFGGLIEELSNLVLPSGGDELFRLVSMVGLLALMSAGAWAWIRGVESASDASTPFRFAPLRSTIGQGRTHHHGDASTPFRFAPLRSTIGQGRTHHHGDASTPFRFAPLRSTIGQGDLRSMIGLAWVPAIVVVAVLNSYLWSGATAFMRAGTEAGVLSILLLLTWARTRLLTLVALGLGSLWLLTAVAQLTKIG